MSLKLVNITKGPEGERTENEYRCDHVRVSFDNMPDVWIRRRITEDEDGNILSTSEEAEILSMNPEVERCLSELEEQAPDAVCVLSDIEDGGLHAIVGPEVIIVMMPPEGTMEFLIGEKIEKSAENPDE